MDGFRSKITSIRNELAGIRLVGGVKRLHAGIYATLFFFGLFVSWVGMQFQGVPEVVTPLSHARILAAETWSDGFIAHDAPPGGLFLQTYQTLLFPKYAAAIQPGESLLPAVGMGLGDPLLGLWLQCALFTLATAWMIRGFASMRWAVIGAFFSAVWFGALSYWGQSFDGWLATGVGVALVWGGARRYASRRGIGNSFILSCGVGLAFLSSPIATLFAIPVPLYLWLTAYFRNGRRGELAVLLLTLFATALIQTAYNQATTGDYLKFPGQAYREKYNNHALFIWQPPSIPPDFDFVRMEQYDLKINQVASRLEPPVTKTWSGRLVECLNFYAGMPVCALLIGALWSGVGRWGKWLLGGAVLSLSSVVIVLPFDLGYAASLACLAPLLGVWAMRSLWTKLERKGVDCWRLSAWLLAAVLVASYSRGFGIKADSDLVQHAKYKKEITEHLLKTESGKHLVLVSYDTDVPPRVEYVYNTSKPDTQDIVWGRWNTRLDASELFAHHEGRVLWLLQVKPSQLPVLRKMDWKSRSDLPGASAPALPGTPSSELPESL